MALKPEDVIDRYLVFDRRSLEPELREKLEKLAQELGKHYFVMDAADPLVPVAINAYVQANNVLERRRGTNQRFS